MTRIKQAQATHGANIAPLGCMTIKVAASLAQPSDAMVEALPADALASAASAAECPPEHKRAGVRPPPSDKIWDGARLATDGITDKTIASVEIDKEPFNIKGRVLRTRTLKIEAGAVVPWHSHDDRPAVMYVVKGELTEYASNCAVPVTYRAGDYVAEGPELSHWWQNLGDETTMLVSTDLLRKEEGD